MFASDVARRQVGLFIHNTIRLEFYVGLNFRRKQ